MALTVNFIDSGVKIENVLRQTSIILTFDAWENFVECSEHVKKAIAEKKIGDWVLDNDKNIRVSISILNNAVYFHIREWYKDFITKKGVSFHEKDWDDLRGHFASSAEMKLGKKVMTTLMRLEAKSGMPESCEGCVNSYPSQRDHDCLMNPSMVALQVMDKADIKPEDFILMLAQEAQKEGLVLEKPHDTFKKIQRFHMQAIKDFVIANDYNF